MKSLLELYPFTKTESGLYNGWNYKHYFSTDLVVQYVNGIVTLARILVNDSWQYITANQLKTLLTDGYVDFKLWN